MFIDRCRTKGFTLIELLVSVAFTTVLVGMALPIGVDAIDDLHTASAARFLAARIAANRMDAISRSRAIGVRFQPSTPDYQFLAFADGNGNGVRTAEITAGIDAPLASRASCRTTSRA